MALPESRSEPVPAPALERHDPVAVLRSGRTWLVRNHTTGALAVLRQVRTPEAELRRRARVLIRAEGTPGGPWSLVPAGGTLHALRPYTAGTPLADVVAGGMLDDARALAIARAVAGATAALHARGVIHGALHPGNVLVRDDGTVALVDGLEWPRPAEGEASGFLAPEILRGAPPAAPADVFATGALVHLLLARRAPFDAEDPLEAVRRSLHADPIPLAVLRPDLGPSLAAAAVATLEKRPRSRPTAAALAEALGVVRPGRAPRVKRRVRPGPTRAERAEPTSRAAPPFWRASAPPLGASTSDPLASARTVRTPGALAWAGGMSRLTGILRASPRLVAAAAIALALVVAGPFLLRSAPPFASEVAERIDAGDLAGARAVLDAAARGLPANPWVEKLRGDLACARGEVMECLRRYRTALATRSAFSSDGRLRGNVLALLGRDEDGGPGLVRVAARLDGIESALADGVRSGRFWVRWNAIRVLEARGEASGIDYADVYARDLAGGTDCATKRAAAAKLAELRDPRILPRLEEARRRENGFLGFLCVGDSISRAIAATRAAER